MRYDDELKASLTVVKSQMKPRMYLADYLLQLNLLWKEDFRCLVLEDAWRGVLIEEIHVDPDLIGSIGMI